MNICAPSDWILLVWPYKLNRWHMHVWEKRSNVWSSAKKSYRRYCLRRRICTQWMCELVWRQKTCCSSILQTLSLHATCLWVGHGFSLTPISLLCPLSGLEWKCSPRLVSQRRPRWGARGPPWTQRGGRPLRRLHTHTHTHREKEKKKGDPHTPVLKSLSIFFSNIGLWHF